MVEQYLERYDPETGAPTRLTSLNDSWSEPFCLLIMPSSFLVVAVSDIAKNLCRDRLLEGCVSGAIPIAGSQNPLLLVSTFVRSLTSDSF